MTRKNEDLKFMRRAIFLAEKGGAYVSPNPRVGAVIVKNGLIVGEGAHGRYGGPHAEIAALRKAGPKARGATLYVTLEPCSHFGKTPPCTEALVRAGIRRVEAAMKDPFPLVAGRGFARLRKAGIQVGSGLLEKNARRINENFLFSVRNKRPKVILKAAVSLDGKITTVAGRSKWITGVIARQKAHAMRAAADAILVGCRTALKDNPALTVRLPGFKRKDGWPLRVVLDSELRTNPRMKIFKGIQKTVVFTSRKASLAREKGFQTKGIQVFRVPLIRKMLSLKAVLRALHFLNVRTLFVEGGGRVHSSFLEQKLADEVVLFISPKILGGNAPTWVGGAGVKNPNHAIGLKNVRWEKVGEDYLLTGKINENKFLEMKCSRD
jgi:diaminohydroxyphosphoribosylaminopyrimidine deaminase/5-amino-6-(5-phosphoribosylamino)uracil reductase